MKRLSNEWIDFYIEFRRELQISTNNYILAIHDKKVEEFKNDGFELTKSLPDDAEIEFVMFSTSPGLI